MPEISWEEHNRRRAKRYLKWILIILISASVAGIIIYNNLDFQNQRLSESVTVTDSASRGLLSQPVEKQHVPKVKEPAPRLEKAVVKPVEQKAPKYVPRVTQMVLPVEKKPGFKASAQAPKKVAEPKAIVVQKPVEIPRVDVESSLDSVIIPIGPSLIRNRNDLRLYCSVVCFVRGAVSARAVMAQQEALQVVIKKLLGEKELASLKLESLRPELRSAIRTAFEDKKIVDIAIRAMRIEKVTDE